MVPTEDNYCDWLITGIKQYFHDRGFAAKSISVGQVKEAELPADRIFAAGNKLLGLQLKRPIRERGHASRTSSASPGAGGWWWRFDKPDQHDKLKSSKWVLYALPLFADVDVQDVALFHFIFAPAAGLDFKAKTLSAGAFWGEIADALLGCTLGCRVEERWSDFRSFARDAYANPADVYVAVDAGASDAWLLDTREAPWLFG